MAKLTPHEQQFLQSKLSGMKAGFTLTGDRLYVRSGVMQFGFVLFEITDSSRARCYGCGVQLPGATEYHCEVTEKWPGRDNSTVTKKPLCYDCAVPQ